MYKGETVRMLCYFAAFVAAWIAAIFAFWTYVCLRSGRAMPLYHGDFPILALLIGASTIFFVPIHAGVFCWLRSWRGQPVPMWVSILVGYALSVVPSVAAIPFVARGFPSWEFLFRLHLIYGVWCATLGVGFALCQRLKRRDAYRGFDVGFGSYPRSSDP